MATYAEMIAEAKALLAQGKTAESRAMAQKAIAVRDGKPLNAPPAELTPKMPGLPLLPQSLSFGEMFDLLHRVERADGVGTFKVEGHSLTPPT